MSTRFCLQNPRLGLTDRVDYLIKAQKAYVQPTTLKMKAHTHIYISSRCNSHRKCRNAQSLMDNVSSTSHLKFTVS